MTGGMPEGERRMKKYNYGHLLLILVMVMFLLSGCGNSGAENNEEMYGDIIAGLGDEEQFSLRDIGEKNDVLFTTDMTYDDDNGHDAALYCRVYYCVDGTIYTLEQIESLGTAYPVSYGDKCMYTAGEHCVAVDEFDRKNLRWRSSQYEETFDADGNASYMRTGEDGMKENVAEKDYLEVWEAYGESTVVNFGYGASDNPF